MICDMADWEQPSTAMAAAAAAETSGSGSGGDLVALREELAAAFERIISLEKRVQDLENEVRAQRGRASGA